MVPGLVMLTPLTFSIAMETRLPCLFCFGLRFGERESGAEAERRQERSRSETTVAVPQAEARRSFG